MLRKDYMFPVPLGYWNEGCYNKLGIPLLRKRQVSPAVFWLGRFVKEGIEEDGKITLIWILDKQVVRI
jgi:hypothetical protein